MITKQIRHGIKLAMIKEDTNMKSAAETAGVPSSTMYRFMRGENDINIVKLDTFCRLGLNRTLMEVLELGK